MIRAILFDIDGVLFDSVKANAEFFRLIFEHFGVRGPSVEEQRRLNHLTIKDHVRLRMGDRGESVVEEAYAYAHTVEHHNDLLELPEEWEEVLTELKSRYALGVVTARIRKSLNSSFDYTTLGRFFTVQIAFEDTERHKPDPEPLLLGAQKLGVKPDDVVYVGDAQSDIDAAKAAGMKMIHYSSETLPGDHATVSTFSNIPAAIDSLSKS